MTASGNEWTKYFPMRESRIKSATDECVCQRRRGYAFLTGCENWPNTKSSINLYAKFSEHKLYIASERDDGVDSSFDIEINYCPFCGKKL